MDIYKQGCKLKVRFNCEGAPKLSLTSINIEQAQDCTLPQLEVIAQNTNRELKACPEETFTRRSLNTDRSLLELKLEILRDIISDRQEEIDRKAKAQWDKEDRENQKEVARQILAARKAKDLDGLSDVELEKLLKS